MLFDKKKGPADYLRKLKPAQIIAIAFLVIIIVGALLLTLPAASRSGKSCGFFPALFTATSATCVTGLVMYDTWQQWSGFGQLVILGMIEIGGLGFMSAASFFIFALRRKIGMRQRMVMAQAAGFENSGGIVRLQKLMLFGSLAVQAIGAVILTIRFSFDFDFFRALKLGVFHSVSGFCNAGFDILGFIPGNSSLSAYAADPAVCITLMALILTGGAGFIVWEEIIRRKKFSRLSVYSKLVIITNIVLVLGGMAAICLTEWENPGTMGGMSVAEKLLSGAFQSVTTRTAGFAALNQGALSDAGKAVSMFLMMIGGSSGSTAGGLKVVTFVVIVLFMWAQARGKRTVNVFDRTIPQAQVLNALTIFGIMVFLALFGAAFISATSAVNFTDGLFESISALATVGITANATPALSTTAQILIMIYMYFGRVGVLTISMGFLAGRSAEERYKFATTNLLIG